MLELTLSSWSEDRIKKATGKSKVFKKYLQNYASAYSGCEFVYRGMFRAEVGLMGWIYEGQCVSVGDLRNAGVSKILVRTNRDVDLFDIKL